METTLKSLAEFLTQQSLQLCILFVLVLAATRWLRSASAHWRYLLWLLVIAKCLTPPIFSLPLPIWRANPTAATTASAEKQIAPGYPHDPVESNEIRHQSTALAAQNHKTGDKQSSVAAPVTNHPTESHSIRARLAAGWFVGFAACFALVARRMWQTQRQLHQTRTPADAATRELLADISRQFGLTKTPSAYTTDAADQPFVWGWLSGSIYLPAQFDRIGDASQRRAILTHELAHVARCDAATNLIQLVVQAAFYFHPLVWWANRELRREREKCCDEFVLSTSSASPRQYCEAIVAVLARAAQTRRPAPVLAVGGQVDAVEERLAAILTPNRRFLRRPSRLAKAAALAVACGILPTALVLTTRAEPADDPQPANAATAAANTGWQKGQQMEVRVVDAETQQPLSDVLLELQNMGKGIDFQDVKKYKTDSEGRSVLTLCDLPPTAVRVYPVKDGYVPLRVYWEDAPWPKLPASITIPLERGKPFGGIVKNADGNPIPGVTVNVHYWARGKGNLPHIRANVDAKTTTDEQGRWHINDMPADVVESDLRVDQYAPRIYFSHPDYVSDHLKRAHIPFPVYTAPTLKGLFDQSATTIMRVGETVRGHVADENGNAIKGAAIHTDQQYWWDKEQPTALTDDYGDFRISGFDFATAANNSDGSAPLQLTIQAADFAPEWIGVRGPGDLPAVTLRRGHSVRGRVVDQSGKPVAGVGIIERRWRDHQSRLGLGMETRADGTFEIADAPADEITYDFHKDGYMTVENFPMTPGGADYTVLLKPPLKFSGSVVDAETNKPIDRCTLVKGIDYDDGRAPDWLRHDTTIVTGGRYETDFEQEGFLWRLRVEAEGYLPGESRPIQPYKTDMGEVTYNFKLQKAKPLSGTLRGLDGQPLAGADVYLATVRMNIDNRKVTSHEGSLLTKTDQAGRFTFPAEVEPFCLVAIHEDGLAMVTEKDFAESPQLQLQPWTEKNHQQQIIRRSSPNVYVTFPPPTK